MHLSCTVMKIWHLKDNGVTRPFDSRVSSSYGWSIVTMRLSGTVTEIWNNGNNLYKPIKFIVCEAHVFCRFTLTVSRPPFQWSTENPLKSTEVLFSQWWHLLEAWNN